MMECGDSVVQVSDGSDRIVERDMLCECVMGGAQVTVSGRGMQWWWRTGGRAGHCGWTDDRGSGSGCSTGPSEMEFVRRVCCISVSVMAG